MQHTTPTSGAAFGRHLDAALRHNPPPARDHAILTRLRPYGIGPGLCTAHLDLATRTALYRGVAGEARALPQTAKIMALRAAERHDGWYSPARDIGRYGTDYAFRAQIAVLGLGANSREEAVYPAGVTDGSGVPYVRSDAHHLTFARGHRPPARFLWSSTMYDSDGYLVANPAHR